MTPLGFWQRVEDLTTSITNRLAKPFRAKATSVTSSGVQIQTYDADAPLGQRYAKLRGSAINVGDEVAVIPYGGSYLVLGSIEPNGVSASSTGDKDIPTQVDSTTDPEKKASNDMQTLSAETEALKQKLDALLAAAGDTS